MQITDFDFYEDDEGLSVDLNLDLFDNANIQFIYLESFVADDKLLHDIQFVLEHQEVFYQLAKKELALYVKRTYKENEAECKLIKVYVFQHCPNTFGMMFRWEGDIEHGIGIKFVGLSIKNIGGSEVAFS